MKIVTFLDNCNSAIRAFLASGTNFTSIVELALQPRQSDEDIHIQGKKKKKQNKKLEFKYSK